MDPNIYLNMSDDEMEDGLQSQSGNKRMRVHSDVEDEEEEDEEQDEEQDEDKKFERTSIR